MGCAQPFLRVEATRWIYRSEICPNVLAPLLALALLVALVGADDVNDAPAAHDLAVLADLLDRRTNFHD
jgi:hypothetical protein